MYSVYLCFYMKSEVFCVPPSPKEWVFVPLKWYHLHWECMIYSSGFSKFLDFHILWNYWKILWRTFICVLYLAIFIPLQIKARKNCKILIFKNILLKITIPSLTPAITIEKVSEKSGIVRHFANSEILVVGSAFNLLRKKSWRHADGSAEKEGML